MNAAKSPIPDSKAKAKGLGIGLFLLVETLLYSQAYFTQQRYPQNPCHKGLAQRSGRHTPG